MSAKTVYPIPVDKTGKVLCEISDGKLFLPTILAEDGLIAREAYMILRGTWGIESFIFFPKESYKIKNGEVFIVDDWRIIDLRGCPRQFNCFLGYDELLKLYDFKVIDGTWSDTTCQIILAALYLQKINQDFKSSARAKLISLDPMIERNKNTITH